MKELRLSDESEYSRRHELVVVQAFAALTQDNDPHQEHDFGSFELAAENFFWKIDYYD
jgi:hypothetical protein